MTTREALILWVKYNHMILNKQQLDIKQIIHFQKIKDDLIRQGIQSIQIQEIKKDRYIIEYQKQSLKKERCCLLQ